MSSPARSWSRMRQATAARYCSRKTESPSASLKARPRSPSVNHWGRGYEPVIVVGRILSRVATSIGAKLPEKEGLMRRRAFLVAMGAAALGLAGRPRLPRAAERGPIRIGYFGPLTGNFSQTGKDMTDGFNLFWEEVGHKVAGREVRVIVADSDPEPTGALTKVRLLVEQEKVHTVAGGLLAATGYAIAPYLEQNKIPTVGDGKLTEENVLKGKGDEALGVITSLIYSAALDTPANKKFSASYGKRHKRTTSIYSAEGYTAARFYYDALRAVDGDAEDKERFLAALRKVEITDDARGPLKMDELGNPIQNVYIRTVERVDGQLQNSVIHTYPNVSQFWTYGKGEYLKAPPYDRNYPPCTFCE